MRYAAISLAVLLLAVTVGGQEGSIPARDGGKRQLSGAAGDATPVSYARTDNGFHGFSWTPVMPLEKGQAAKLKEAIQFTDSAIANLANACALYAEGGNKDGARRVLKVAESLNGFRNEVSSALDQRERVLSQRVSDLELELSRVKDELGRTTEGGEPIAPDPVQGRLRTPR